MALPSFSPSCSESGGVTCSQQYGTEPGNLSPSGHLLVAIFLGIIGSLGFFSNLLVLVLFCQYRVLRSPINMLLMNISLSDLMVCILGTPFSFAASTQGQWLIGEAGCVWYGFVNTLFGTVSLVSLAVLSYERYCTMLGSTEADVTNYKKAWLGILVSWVYSLFWTLPPLFGWSSYGPEGPGTTCSVNWHSRDAINTSYIVCLFLFCLALPFFVIVYCYGRLLVAIKQFYRCFIALLHCSSAPQTSSIKGSSKTTKICLATRKLPENQICNAASSKCPTSEEDKNSTANTKPAPHCQEETKTWHLQQKPSVILVAHYTP
ncbi:opsin-3-like isoform X2 [Pyxicephalus adspersus]|uniref:opsin-3-like isoform X2 n=1 Tax=Pyxicephalus adspersus TaxID=30357 RepID=UPI003B5AB0B8